MILYLDTSALVKLYAEEPGREEVENAGRESRVMAVSEIGYAGGCSALARKEREGSFSTDEHAAAVEQLRQDYREAGLPRPITGDLISRDGYAVAAMLCVIFAWNELLLSVSFASVEWGPLSVAAASQQTSWGQFFAQLLAFTTLAIIVLMIVGWLTRKQLVWGLTSGAVK